MISQQTIDKIMNAVDIVDVISDFRELRKSGKQWVCLCPFHADTQVGSFGINRKKGICYCFSCEKGGDAVYYLMEAEGMSYPDALRYLGKKYGIEVEGSEKFNYVKPSKPRDWSLQPQSLPVFTLPMTMYERSAKHIDDDVLVKFIRGLNWDAAQRSRIDSVLSDYHVGTATTKMNEQYTVFWYCDEEGRLCTGKMIRYKYNGHRMKESDGIKNGTDWIHAWLYRSKVSTFYDRDKVDWKRTYYGMDLVRKYPNSTVNIVESEKTAVIMSIAYGSPDKQVWMACGSKSNLTRERLQPLIDRNKSVVLYPDRDGVGDWEDTCKDIGYKHMTVNSDPVMKWWRQEDGPKADIADVVLRLISKPFQQNPVVKKMIEKLNLETIQ